MLQEADRSALVFYGKVGTLFTAAKYVDGPGDPRVIHRAAASIVRCIIEPWTRQGTTIDVFAHSWNPELGPHIDGWYAPRLSNHSDAQQHEHADHRWEDEGR